MNIAIAVKHMLAAGMSADAIVAAVAEMESAAPLVDPVTQRKRDADRVRIAKKRQIERDSRATSATSRDNATPLVPPLVSPKPPSEHPPIIPHAALSSAGAIDYDLLEIQCREAAGAESNPSPALRDISPIIRCIDGGATMEGDVLPALRRMRGKTLRTWDYAVGAIMDAKARREAPLPEGRATGPPRSSAARPDAGGVTALHSLILATQRPPDDRPGDERNLAIAGPPR